LSIENYTLVARAKKSVPFVRPFTRFPRATHENCAGYSDLECAIVGDTCARFVDTMERQKSTSNLSDCAFSHRHIVTFAPRKSCALKKTHKTYATRTC